MNMYSLYEFGIECADHHEIDFCYESVRDEFFSDISGEFITEAKKQKRSALDSIKEWLKRNKKRIALLAAGIAAVVILVSQLRKRNAVKEAKEIEKKANDLKKQYRDLRKSQKELEDAVKAYDKEIDKAQSKLDEAWKPYGAHKQEIKNERDRRWNEYERATWKFVKTTDDIKHQDELRKRNIRHDRIDKKRIQGIHKRYDDATADVRRTRDLNQWAKNSATSDLHVIEQMKKGLEMQFHQAALDYNAIAKKYKLKPLGEITESTLESFLEYVNEEYNFA